MKADDRPATAVRGAGCMIFLIVAASHISNVGLGLTLMGIGYFLFMIVLILSRISNQIGKPPT